MRLLLGIRTTPKLKKNKTPAMNKLDILEVMNEFLPKCQCILLNL